MERQRKALFTLLFLSPTLAELVSGSSPPLEFFNPPGLAGLLALYGCGALLIRDAVIRWNKGWMSLIFLGMAYGVYEEGLVVKSWFDPNWVDLGTLGVYGRVGGLNWAWAASLTTYHAIVSIALPIFLTDILFPDFKGKRLLTPRATRWALFFFALIFPVFAVLALPYWGGPEHLIAVVCGLGFLAAAWYAPRDFLTPRAQRPPRRVFPFALFGFLWMASPFLIFGVGPAAGLYFGLAILACATVNVASLLVLREALYPATAERCLFAFMGGVGGLICLFGFLYGIANPVAAFGMPVVGVAAALWFVRLYRKNMPRWAQAEAAFGRAGPASASGP